MTTRSLTVQHESWPLARVFRISRGEKTHADVLLLTLKEGAHIARAEAVPYARYNETIESVIQQIEYFRPQIEQGIDIHTLDLPAGSASNALDCAMWELKAKKQHTTVSQLVSITPSKEYTTAQTLSIDTPERMATEAKCLLNYPLVKIKLDQDDVLKKMTAIFHELPNSQFIIDANEAWSIHELNQLAKQLIDMNVVLIEQPLPAKQDSELQHYTGRIALCADESIHTSQEVSDIAKYYHYINIKLDKTGGLTEAIKLLHAAKAKKLGIMVGCMVGTSLAMAPATILASQADYVDLDGPALLAQDRKHGFRYKNGIMSALNPTLWGGFNKAQA